MKKSITLTMSLILALLFAACSGSGEALQADPANPVSSPPPSPSPSANAERTEPFTTDDAVMGNTSANLRIYGTAAAQGNWIYYAGDEDALYRMTLDGSMEEKIADADPYYINVMGDTVFYAGYVGRGVYRIPAAGGSPKKLCDNTVTSLAAAGAWLYFRDEDDSLLYRMSQSGGEPEKIGSRMYDSFFIHDAAIFASYRNDTNMQVVDRISLSDLTATQFLEGNSLFCGEGSWLYGTNEKNDRIRVSLDGTETETLGMSGYQDTPFEGRIYSHGNAGQLNGSAVGSLYVRNPEDRSGTLLFEGYCFNPNVVPGWIFFREYSEASKEVFVIRIPIDGGDPIPIP